MNQSDFNIYVSVVLSEFNIDSKIIWQKDDPRSSLYDIVVKLPDDKLIFHTFAFTSSQDNIEIFYCYLESNDKEFFDVSFDEFYNTTFINSGSCTHHSVIKGNKIDTANKIKEIAREKIIFALEQLDLINQETKSKRQKITY